MQLPTPAPAPVTTERRRTQLERRERTQLKLVRATVECLVERGYHGTTTLEVERRAGVSRGARIHHFPTKAILLAGAVDHLYGELGDHYDAAFGGAAGDSEAQRFRRGFALLWSIYCRPGYLAVLELVMAARTDDELRERMDEVAERHRLRAVEAAARYFPSLDSGTASVLIEALQSTMMGVLLQRGGAGEYRFEADVLAWLERAVTQYLPLEEA